jgi:hypothetical protein
LLGSNYANVINGKFKEIVISLLNELRDLQQKVTDPNWLDTLGPEDGQLPNGRPKSLARKRQRKSD